MKLLPRLIPCLDIKDGRVVKGVRFQGLRDAGDPVELASAYEAQGADELVVLDVSATEEQRRAQLPVISQLRAKLSIPMTVGGGLRTVEDAERYLSEGADKIAVNTAAVHHPELLDALSQRFGRQCTVLSLDAKRVAGPGVQAKVLIRAGKETTELDAIAWAQQAQQRGAGEILLTSWDRDGTGDGYELELLAAICEAVQIPVIASGGASSAAHMHAALRAGASAVLAASIFHDAKTTVHQVKTELLALGVEVRR